MVHSPHRSLMSPNDFTFASLNRDNPKTTSESEQQPPDHLRLTPTLRPTLAPDAPVPPLHAHWAGFQQL